jgi:DNA-binding transcriptional MocR family regulator
MSRTITARQLNELLSSWRQADGIGYRALADRIRLLVVDGRIAVGARLPSERELAGELGVSRTTVAAALDALRAAAVIETRRGSGSVVLAPAGARGSVGESIEFTTASPPAPPAFAPAAARALEALTGKLAGAGYELLGVPELRQAIADRFTARGLPTRPTQIMVTSGAQAALSLLARALIGRGDRAVVETPGYPRAHEALRDAGARLLALPVDADSGWDHDEADQLLRRAAPSLLYSMPDFHNPTGRSLSEIGRERMIRAAHDVGAAIVIDETTAELDIDRAETHPPFAALASPRSRIITVGSASKTVWGGLRIGWIRAGEDIISGLVSARPSGDLGTAVLEQLIVAELLRDFDALLDYRREEQRRARDAITDAVLAALPTWHIPAIDGGLAAWLRFDAPVSSQLAIGARARGLSLAAGPWFGLDGAFERFIRIPFGPGAEAGVRAVGILAEVWSEVADSSRMISAPLAAVV